jgi:hypothetical protein
LHFKIQGVDCSKDTDFESELGLDISEVSVEIPSNEMVFACKVQKMVFDIPWWDWAMSEEIMVAGLSIVLQNVYKMK